VEGDILATDYFKSPLPSGRHQFLFDFTPEWIRISIKEDRLRPRFPSKFLQLVYAISPANHQPPADCSQVLGERCETSAQELLPIRTRPTMTSRPTAYYIDRDELGGTAAGDCKSGVVGNPKITAKPENRRFHRPKSSPGPA
jgi:hypothetical protein